MQSNIPETPPLHRQGLGVDTATMSPMDKKKALRELLDTGARARLKKASLGSAEMVGDPDEGVMTPGFAPSLGGVPFEIEGDQDEKLRMLDRFIRWDAFIYHSHYFHPEAIVKIYGANITADHQPWKVARTKYFDNIKAYKGQVLSAIKTHVVRILGDDDTNHIAMVTDGNQLRTFFSGQYNTTNLYFCFNYMKDYVDIESSSPLGQYYAKGMFSSNSLGL